MWTGSGVTARASSTNYSLGARMVIALGDTSANYLVTRKYVFECTTQGTSSAGVPTWLASYTPDTTTVTDGTVVWKARNPGYSNGSTVDWSFATIYFTYLIAAVSTAGDVGLIHYTSADVLSADTTYTFTDNTRFISVDKDNSSAPTVMGTTGYIGNTSGTSVSIGLTGPRTYFYGLTFRTGGTNNRTLSFVTSDGDHMELESCYFYWGTTNTSGPASISIGVEAAAIANYIRFINCTFRFGATAQGIYIRQAKVDIEGGSISSDGSIPSVLFLGSPRSSPDVTIQGMDLSSVTGTLVGNSTQSAHTYKLIQCKLGAGVTMLASQTDGTKGTGIAIVYDCSSGDTHTTFGYHDAFGSCVSDTGIYYTTGAAGQSWKITTTSNCSYYTPFVSQFVDYYNTGTSAITPYFEILRDGNATAFQNDEVWAEFWIKTTSGSTQSTRYDDSMALLGTPADQANGSGTGSWTGEQATAWSGKVDSGASVTPSEAGAIRGRLVVGEPSITVYFDPQVRF